MKKSIIIQPDDIDIGMFLSVHSVKNQVKIPVMDGQLVSVFQCPIKGSILRVKAVQLPLISVDIVAGPYVGSTSPLDIRDYNFMKVSSDFVNKTLEPFSVINNTIENL